MESLQNRVLLDPVTPFLTHNHDDPQANLLIGENPDSMADICQWVTAGSAEYFAPTIGESNPTGHCRRNDGDPGVWKFGFRRVISRSGTDGETGEWFALCFTDHSRILAIGRWAW